MYLNVRISKDSITVLLIIFLKYFKWIHFPELLNLYAFTNFPLIMRIQITVPAMALALKKLLKSCQAISPIKSQVSVYDIHLGNDIHPNIAHTYPWSINLGLVKGFCSYFNLGIFFKFIFSGLMKEHPPKKNNSKCWILDYATQLAKNA